MIAEEQFLPLSALQHFLYCPRQCALIHLEQVWAENKFTVEGNQMHARAHDGPDESRPGVRITRGLPVVSRRLGVSGQCDVVEFKRSTGSPPSEASGEGWVPPVNPGGPNPISATSIEGESDQPMSSKKQEITVTPIEYKRGKPKAHRADEVQVCAQGLALEEMLGVEIPRGLLFYGRTHRRVEVPLDATLRELTADLAERMHAMFSERATPAAEYEPRKCGDCSLIELCQPRAARRSAARWFQRQLRTMTTDP